MLEDRPQVAWSVMRDEYVEGSRYGREVWQYGERDGNVTAHPALGKRRMA